MDTSFSSQRGSCRKKSARTAQIITFCCKCVNLIKARPLNERLFSCLSGDMDADQQALHSEALHCFCIPKYVRWLSPGRMPKRVRDLRDEIVIFLRKQNFMALSEKFSQEDFNPKIAYLADIFDSLHQCFSNFFSLRHTNKF